MSYFMNVQEVFGVAVEIEKNGKAFYTEAMERAKTFSAKQLFQELAHWEEKHVEFFESLSANLKSPSLDGFEEPTQESMTYLKAAADNHVFTKASAGIEAAARCKTTQEVLDTALQFEKDSVVYYSAMRTAVPESMGGAAIAQLIQEELKHVAILTEKKKTMA